VGGSENALELCERSLQTLLGLSDYAKRCGGAVADALPQARIDDGKKCRIPGVFFVEHHRNLSKDGVASIDVLCI
jgi:hypothetical protein